MNLSVFMKKAGSAKKLTDETNDFGFTVAAKRRSERFEKKTVSILVDEPNMLRVLNGRVKREEIGVNDVFQGEKLGVELVSKVIELSERELRKRDGARE